MFENTDIKTVREILKIIFELKNCLIGQVREKLQKYNINRSESIAIMSIYDNKKINMSELCSYIDLKSGSLTSLIDNLIKKGYVKREFDKNDRRKILISLTAKGKTLSEIIRQSFEENAISRIKKLNPEEVKKFSESIETLNRITARLKGDD